MYTVLGAKKMTYIISKKKGQREPLALFFRIIWF